MLYEVVLFESDPYERGHRGTETRKVGSLRAAELLSESLLRSRPVVTTDGCYHRDVARGAWCGTFAPGKHRPVQTIDAPVHIVPSVGDLGWSP